MWLQIFATQYYYEVSIMKYHEIYYGNFRETQFRLLTALREFSDDKSRRHIC
jgi:hypothetical protein